MRGPAGWPRQPAVVRARWRVPGSLDRHERVRSWQLCARARQFQADARLHVRAACHRAARRGAVRLASAACGGRVPLATSIEEDRVVDLLVTCSGESDNSVMLTTHRDAEAPR